MFAILSVGVAGCQSTRVGAPCSLGVADATPLEPSETTATINPGTPSCPGGICVLPARDKVTTTGALCSADCSSDSDCGDADLTRDGADPRCKSGFSCVVITTVGEFCCRKLCACRDFFSVPAGGVPTPTACLPGVGSTCQNVH